MTEQVKEARMSAAVKLQRAFQRQQEKSEASRKRGEELLKQARETQEKKQQTNEETTEQSADRKKQLKKFSDMVASMGCDKSVTEGTIQPSGTDKVEVAGNEVPSSEPKGKRVKEFKFFSTNESYTFDTAAMAKQELADAKNKKHRKRGKVANLLRKLGMKEEVEQIDEIQGANVQEELTGGQTKLDKNKNGKLDKQDFKLLRSKLKEAKMGKPVDVDKVHTAGEKPHEEKWEDAKKVKKESFTADELLQALKEGLWPGTPEHKAKFGDKYAQQQGGGAGIKRGTRYGGSAQKPEKEDDDADDKPAKQAKNK